MNLTQGSDEILRRFFQGSPTAEISVALKNVRSTTKKLRAFIKASLKNYDLLIGQGNRPDRIHTHLIASNVLPKFDYYFTGSKIGEEQLANKWFEREHFDANNEHTPYIWNSPVMWENFFDILDKNRDKKILVSSSAPRKEHMRLQDEYPNVLFTSPWPEKAVYFGDDKRRMQDIYNSVGLQYDVVNYDSSESVLNDYVFHSNKLGSKNLVVQATKGSGGVTENDKQALFFIENESQFRNAIEQLNGEGPIRIMKKYEGVPSNTSALCLPFATYISGIPSVKPCGLSDVGARPGTGAGNQWDLRFPSDSITSQITQLIKVGEKMATSGYCGVFGLDPIMPMSPGGLVFNSEINARAQGPDSQRAFAAHQIGIPTLEEMQIAFYLGCPFELFPNMDEYNLITRWLRISPYLKLFPKSDRIVKSNLNGYWRWNGKTLSKSTSGNGHFKISGAPYINQKILQSSPDNFLYIKYLNPKISIFTGGIEPVLTDKTRALVDYIYETI